MYISCDEGQKNKLKSTGRKGTFIGYYENYKALRIYIPSQRKVEIRRYVTFDEDVTLGKVRDLPLPPPKKRNDDMDILDGPSMLESKTDIVDDPMEPMDPLDPPPSDTPTRKRPIWLMTHYRIMRDKFPSKYHLGKGIIHAGTRDML